MSKINILTASLIDYFKTDVKRINHALKVNGYARAIGKDLKENQLLILEAASLLHDIGIKEAELLYGNCTGALQEKLGPPVAELILKAQGWSQQDIDEICFLIGHHHTYGLEGNLLLQILIEADFIVNLYEGEFYDTSPLTIRDKFFKTREGIEIFNCLYNLV